MTNQLFETIYNGCNSIAENAYLESPLDTELKPPMLMEDIYFECNVKPLFEQVLREMAIPFNLGLNQIRNLVTTDVTRQPDRVRTILNKMLAMDRGTDRSNPTFLNPEGQEINFQEWITAILDTIRQERVKTYSNDLDRATQYIQQVSNEVYNDLNV